MVELFSLYFTVPWTKMGTMIAVNIKRYNRSCSGFCIDNWVIDHFWWTTTLTVILFDDTISTWSIGTTNIPCWWCCCWSIRWCIGGCVSWSVGWSVCWSICWGVSCFRVNLNHQTDRMVMYQGYPVRGFLSKGYFKIISWVVATRTEISFNFSISDFFVAGIFPLALSRFLVALASQLCSGFSFFAIKKTASWAWEVANTLIFLKKD